MNARRFHAGNLPILLMLLCISSGCSESDDPLVERPPVIEDRDRWYVNASAAGAGDGSSWEDAFRDIQTAIDYAKGGDVVWVSKGTYNSPDPGDSSVPVVRMKLGVDIYGGFSSASQTLADRDFDANRTVLDGENRTWHVVIGAQDARLDGFIVQSGLASGAYPDNCGGGMLNLHVSPEVENCVFTSNDAGFHGSGMANVQASPLVRNCIFRLNVAANNGAGVHNDDFDASGAHPVFEDCKFGPGNSCRFGAGMYNRHCEVTVTDCVFSNNIANHNGGGMYNRSSTVTVTSCVFRENRAYDGAGLYMNGLMDPDSTRLYNCLIESNVASVNGGGLYLYVSSSAIINCTIAENSSIYGGGASCWLSEAAFLNCILWGNVAYNLYPSIEIGPDIHPDISHCDIDQEGYGAAGTGLADSEGNIRLDPMFETGPLGDRYLASGSPCIDAGTPTSIDLRLLGILTTRTDGTPDAAPVDIGFHYLP